MWKKVLAVMSAVGFLCGVAVAQPYIQGCVSKSYEETPSYAISFTAGVESTFLVEPLVLDLHYTSLIDVVEDTFDLSWTAGGSLGVSSDQGFVKVGLDYGPESGLWLSISFKVEFGLGLSPQTEVFPGLTLQ